jgi:hypothetical protein
VHRNLGRGRNEVKDFFDLLRIIGTYFTGSIHDDLGSVRGT